MKKNFLRIFFQCIALILIIKLIFYNDENFENFNFFYSSKIIYLFLFSVFIKLFLTYLFYLILKILSSKQINYIDISNFFLQGGVINQLLPGVGFIYKYYKLKSYANINVIEYSTAQSIWTLFVFFSYMIIALILGLIIISFSKVNLLIFITILTTTIIIFLLNQKKLFYMLISKILKFKNFPNAISNLKILKDKIINKPIYFLYLLIGFVMLAIIQCVYFYFGLVLFDANVSFINSTSIYISSTLASFITLINFMGLFEFILTISSSFIDPDFQYMLVFAFGLRLINLSATFTVITLFSLRKLINKIRT